MDYEVVIGLEVHVELKTKVEISCSCSNSRRGTQLPRLSFLPGAAWALCQC